MRHAFTALTAILLLASATARADTKTVSWYVAHPDARARVYALCQDNPGQARHVANCINVAEAIKEAAKRQIPTTTVFDMCDQMSGLFQRVNHCGPLGGAR